MRIVCWAYTSIGTLNESIQPLLHWKWVWVCMCIGIYTYWIRSESFSFASQCFSSTYRRDLNVCMNKLVLILTMNQLSIYSNWAKQKKKSCWSMMMILSLFHRTTNANNVTSAGNTILYLWIHMSRVYWDTDTHWSSVSCEKYLYRIIPHNLQKLYQRVCVYV